MSGLHFALYNRGRYRTKAVVPSGGSPCRQMFAEAEFPSGTRKCNNVEVKVLPWLLDKALNFIHKTL